MDWNEQIGNVFFFKLYEGGCYTGEVIFVDEKFNTRIEILDKFGLKVGFNESDIKRFNMEKFDKFHFTKLYSKHEKNKLMGDKPVTTFWKKKSKKPLVNSTC